MEYIEGYGKYKPNKYWMKMLLEKLIPNAILVEPWAHIIVDFITKLL